MTFNSKQCTRREPLYDINPRTGVTFEVFYSDRTLETFGRGGTGWFWWSREVVARQRAPRPARSLRAIQHIATPWGPIWGLRATPS